MINGRSAMLAKAEPKEVATIDGSTSVSDMSSSSSTDPHGSDDDRSETGSHDRGSLEDSDEHRSGVDD